MTFLAQGGQLLQPPGSLELLSNHIGGFVKFQVQTAVILWTTLQACVFAASTAIGGPLIVLLIAAAPRTTSGVDTK